MLRDIGGLLPYPTNTFSIIYKPGMGHKDADALSHIKWPEAMELDTQKVHALSVKVFKLLMVKWKHFAMGLK